MSKKFISIVLIVSMVFVNNGFFVLASSIETVVAENQNNAEEGVKLYYEESEETIIVDVAESEETIINVAEGEEESVEINNNAAEPIESIDDVLEAEPEEEEEPEESEETEKTNEAKDIETTNEINELEELEEESEVATESELEEEIKSVLETEPEEEIETSTESELRIDLEEEMAVATESEPEEEIEVSTESELEEEIETSTESEPKKEIIVATVSKITWKVIKIFIATHSSARINANRKDEKVEARLATQANVLIENNLGDQKIVKVDLNWKLEKKYEINARTTEKKDAVKPEVWKEKLGADKFIEEKNKEKITITATSNIADIEEEVKKENENFDDKEIIVVVEAEEAAEEAEENEIKEKEQVEAFVNTEEISVEETPSEANKINIDSCENETGSIGNDSIKDISLAHYDVQSIEFWSIDMDKLGENILEAIKDENKETSEEKNADEFNAEKGGIVNNIFKSINNLFASESKDNEKNAAEEKTAESVAKNFSLNKMVQAIAPTTIGSPMVEVTQFFTTPGSTHSGGENHDIYNTILSGYSERVHEYDIDNNSSWADIDGIDQTQIGTGSQIKVEGKYYLTHNFRIDKLWAIPDGKKLYICLNGFNLTFAVEKGEPESGGVEGAIEQFINNDGTLGLTGEVYVCNCATNASHISAEPPVYGMTDKFFASTSEVYTKYKERSLISAPKVFVFGKNENIIFDNNIIKNKYTGYHVRNMQVIPEEDYSFNGGGGSILNAAVDMKVVGVRFENNIATRTNGVAINSMRGKLLVEKSYFKNNVNNSSKGGALALNPMDSEIYDTVFEENVSETVGGAIYGKAFKNARDTGTGTKIQKVTFKNNKAKLDGGAIYFDDMGPNKEVTIGGVDPERQKCTFIGNVSGTKGGAIAFRNVVEDRISCIDPGFAYNPPNEGKLIINNCEFDENICKDLTDNNTQLDNKGGAISLDNCDLILLGTSEDNNSIPRKILKNVEIRNTLFKNNRAEGKELEVHKYTPGTFSIIGETGYKLTLQSYGGAIFASGFYGADYKFLLEKVEMQENEATSGANLCLNKATVELKECNIHDNKFTKVYKNDAVVDLTNSSTGIKNLADLSITPGGGAAYLMNGAKLIVDKDTKIVDNMNALYVDNADIEIAGESINGNTGEYLIGSNNKTENTVTFDSVNIIDNGGHAVGADGWEADGRIVNRKKDYYIDTGAKTKADKHEVFTKVLFKGDFLTINNNERKYSNQVGQPIGTEYTYDKSEECNIDIRSTKSNLQLDLSQHLFTISEDRIGLHYDIEAEPQYNGTFAYTTWNPIDVKGYNYGDLWHTLFSLDNSDEGEAFERWGYIKDDTNPERILIVNGITRIRFNSYIQGARKIASQFYQVKAPDGGSENIKISTPTELQNAAYNTGGKTVLGFVGKHTKDQTDWDPWDFNVDEVTVESGQEEVEFIVIYADSQIKLKACGLPNDIPCNHPDGSVHIPRGGVDAHDEAARYTNYVLVATYAQLSYKYKFGDPSDPKYNKRTQYILDKDIFFDGALAEKFIHGDIILNLNGKTLNVDCSGTSIPIFKASNSTTPGIALPDGNTHIVIAGRATTANIENGKIVFTNNNNISAPLVDTNGSSVYITDVKIDGYKGINTSLIKTNTDLNSTIDNEIVIESCDIRNVETVGPVDGDINTITGAHNIYLSNSRFTNIKNENGVFVKPVINVGSIEKTPLLEINKSTISYFDGKSIFLTPKATDSVHPLDPAKQKGVKIIIASSSINNSKFADNGIELITSGFNAIDRDKSKFIFRGINQISNNECTKVGKSIVLNDYNYIFDDENGETVFDNNKTKTSDSSEGYIMKMSNTSTASILNGGLIFRNNKNVAQGGSDKLSAALYIDSDNSGGIAKIKIGKGYLYVDGNENKYNIYVNNNQLTKDSEIFMSDDDTKLDVSKTKLSIGLATNEYEQLIYKDYKPENMIGDVRIEKLFVRSGTTEPIYNTYRKSNANDNIDVYFGKEYVTGRFKLYDYSEVAKDERDNSIPYNTDIYENYEHRIASGSSIKLDKVDTSGESDEIYWSKGLYVDDVTDVSKEYVVHKNVNTIRVNENKDFIISGYRSKTTRHIHENTGNQDWWLEARNEAHLQPCTESYIFLHNDITITHSLFDNADSKLDSEYRICLNGHKLMLAKDINWLAATQNVNVEICDCSGAGSIEQNRTALPKYHSEFISMSNGKLNMHDIKVSNFDVLSNGVDKAGFINIDSASYNTNGEFNVKNVNFSGNKVEYIESDLIGTFIKSSNFATQSIIDSKFENNTLITNKKDQYFIKFNIDDTVDRSLIIDNLNIGTNVVDGQGSFARFEDYKNYVFKDSTINNNTVYGGSPLSVKGRGNNVSELGFTNVKFEDNRKKAKAEFTIASPNSANLELTGIKKLVVNIGSFKNASYDTNGIVDAATVSTVLHINEDTEVYMYDVTFDGNNAVNPTAKSSRAFYFNGNKDISFENCTFKGGNAESSDLIEIDEGYNGNIKFIGTTNFDNVKARYIVNVKSANAILELKNTIINGSNAQRVFNLEKNGAKLILDGVNANNNIVVNSKEFAYIGSGAIVLSSGSNIINTNGRVFNIESNNVTLYDTVIQGNGTNVGPAIDLGGNIKLGDKVVIKGYQRNLRFSMTGKIIGDVGHKLVEGSEIYITGNVDNHNFFDGWGSNYIEDYGKHNPISMDINDWSYLPERIFKVDDTNNIIYKKGTGVDRELYICNKVSNKYVTIKFVDEDEKPELGYSIYQYIAASPSGATLLDLVQVGYLSTSSQAWKHNFNQSGPGIGDEALWRVNGGLLSVNDVENGEYIVKLAKIHIHYECGAFLNTECHHIGGTIHNTEQEYYEIYSPDKIASASDGTNAFGLKKDMVFTQADIDELADRAGTGKDTIYLCLEGKTLTLADNAKFGSTKKLVITNCEEEAYIKVATGSYINYPIINTGSNDLRIYNTKINGIKVTANNAIFAAAGNVVIENVCIEDCESNSERGLIDIPSSAHINNVKLSKNTINDNASHNSILYNASQEYTLVNNLDIGTNSYATKLVKITTSKYGNINVKNNKIIASTDSSINHYGALTIENSNVEIYDSIIEGNDASKAVNSLGGGITLLSGNVVFKNDVNIVGNKAIKGGAIYTDDYSARKFTFGGASTQSVLIKSNEADEGGALYVKNINGLTFKENTIFQENKGIRKGVIYYTGDLLLPNGLAFKKNSGLDLVYNETSGSLIVNDIVLTGNGLAGAAFKVKGLATVTIDNIHRLTTNTFESLLNVEDCNNVTINNVSVGGSSFVNAAIIAKNNANGVKISSSSFIGNTVTNGAISLNNTVLKIQDNNLKVYDNIGPANKNRDIYINGGVAYVEPTVMLATTSRMGFSSREDGVLVFKGWDNTHIKNYNIPIEGRDHAFTPETSYELFASNEAVLKGYELYKSEIPGEIYIGSNEKFAKITFMDEDLTSTYTTQNIRKSSLSNLYSVRLNTVDTFECDLDKQSWQIPKLDGTYQIIDDFNTISADIIATTNLIARYIKPHMHKDCGVDKNEVCVHENGITHLETDEREYKAVASVEDIKNSTTGYMYLINDIIATESITLPYGMPVGICLNGFSIICSSTSDAVFVHASSGMTASNVLTITNCKDHGGFELKEGEHVRENEFIRNESGNVNVYNVTIGKETKHIKASNSIIYNRGGDMYVENLNLQYIDEIGDDGLLKSGGTKAYYHKLTVYFCNANNLLVVDNKTEFGDITIKRNIAKHLLNIEGSDVKAKSINLDSNNINITGLNIDSGKQLSVSDTINVRGNNVVTSGQNVIFVKAGKLNVASMSTFTNNQTERNAIIHIEDAAANAINFGKSIFENNRPGVTDDDGAAVISWDGELSLVDIEFRNHTTNKPLIRNYKKVSGDNRDKLVLENPKFINNTGACDAILLDNTDAGSIIEKIEKENIAGNAFKNLVKASSGSLAVKDIDVDGGNYSESIIAANEMDDITFASISIINTNPNNFAINLTNTKIGLEGKIIVKDNAKNIKLNNGAYFFMNGSEKLTKDSKLYIDAGKGAKIFDGWTLEHVEGYRNLSYDPENTIHLYTPENSGIFNLEQSASSFNVYKKGTGSNTSVYVGKENEEYVVLRFKQEADPDPIECIDEYDFGTQNVAKGVETQLDVVDSFEYEEYKQLWKAPDIGSVGHTETWCFMEPGGTVYYDVISTYSSAKTITYYIRHIHRACGAKLNETCMHEYSYAEHDTTYEYLEATDSVSFKSLLNDGKFIVLKNNITIEIANGQTEYQFSKLEKLCLNGRKLTIKIIGSADYNDCLFDASSHDLTICDCKRRKGYEGSISVVNQGSVHLIKPFIQVTYKNAYITDVTFDGISIGNTSGGTLITARNGSGKAYVENAKIKNATWIGYAKGLFETTNVSGINLYNAEFSHNSSGQNFPMITLTENIKVTTLSIIDNYKDGGASTDTKVSISGNANVDTLYVNGNKTNSSGIIEILDGASLTLTKESVFENNQGGEGGVMNIKGILTAEKDVVFRENQAGSGGAIYISDNGKVIGLGTISFIKNRANQTGAAIYAKNTKENTFNFAKVIFDGNTKGNQPTVNSVVEADGGILKLVNPIFVNHGTDVKAIIRNIKPNSIIKIENPIFINNRTDNDAFYFNQIASGSEIIGLDKNNIIGNKFKNFINMDGTYKLTGTGIVVPQDINLLTVSGSLENGEYIDSVITVKNTYDPGIPGDPSRNELASHVTFASLSIVGNKIISGAAAVLLTGDKASNISNEPIRSGRIAIKGKVVIDENLNSKNLYIANDKSWLQGADDYIDPKSCISIKVYEADKPVFRGWSSENFENYNNPDNTLSPLTYTFTPENSGIFKSADATLGIYKVGDIDEDVYIGNDYVTLTWKNDFDDPTEEVITYCTQNVKKGENVKIDVVDTFEYELYKQEWYDPTHDPRDKAFVWRFADPTEPGTHPLIPLKKTFTEDTTIWYRQRHIHKECGQKLLNLCTHISPIAAHTETKEYVINDGAGVNSVEQISTFMGEYLMLRGDITVTEPITLGPNIVGICLNGKTIKSDGVTGNLFNINSGTLKICNCKNKGGIRIADQLTHNGHFFNVSGSANVETYNINYGYDPIDVPEGSEHETTKLNGSIMNVSDSAKGYIERGKVAGFTMAGINGLFSNTSTNNLTLTDFDFIRNEISVTDDPLLKLDNKITLGTISIIENTVKGSALEISGNVNLISLNVNNNKSINSAVISVPAGSTLNLSGDTVIKNDSGSKGGALYIKGTFNANADIVFENNTAINGDLSEKLYGGAVFVDEGGKFNVSGDAKFTKNNAKYGSSIYAYKSAIDTFNINHAEFLDEKNDVGGIISWTGDLKLASVSFVSNNGLGALIENDTNDCIAGGIYTGVSKLELSDVYMSANVAEKDGIKLSGIGESKIINLNVDDIVGINKFENVINVISTDSPSEQVFITNANIKNTNYKNAGINIADDIDAVINNINADANKGTNYGVILIKGLNTKLRSIGDVFINHNTSSGNYGAAITILDGADVKVLAASSTGEHFNISNNKSNGGAVFVDGKLGLEGKVIINGNTNNSNQPRNIYITNADSYTYGSGGAISADSQLSYTGFDNNTLVFKGWTESIIPNKTNPPVGYCYTPENCGIFLKDQDAISSGKEFYKSGVMNNCSVKLGKEFVKLSFVSPDKLTTFCTQNIEKNIDTELDKVTTRDSYGNYVTWVAPGENSQATENWVFESEIYDAKYDANKDIIKSYIYSVIFTGGTHSAEFPNDERIVRYGDTVAMPYWSTVIPGATFRAWKIRNPLQGMNPTLHEGDNVSNLSLTENGIAYVDAAFEGEYYVKFIPNLETIGLAPESIGSVDVISHGEAVSLTAKFGSQGNYNLASYNTKSDGTGTTYSIGSSVTPTDDINLYAQWSAAQPTPTPTPTPHRGGGGGGGGGVNHSSDGTIINGIYIPNGIDPLHPQIERRFILREDGSIVDEAGNIVGNINIGDVLNEDGSFTAVNGITKYPDGRLKDQNGYIFNTDGSITLPDGNTYYIDGRMKDGYGNMIYPDGKVEFIDGTVKDVAGILHHPDGSITTVDGIRYYLDGRVVLPDGREITKDNILTGTTQGDTIGNFVFDVKTNKYKFVSKDKAGNNVELSDQWILKTDQSGKQKWYMVNHDGNMSTGWVKKDGEYYYMSKDVANLGELVVGRKLINGKTYEFDSDGKLINGVAPVGELDVIGAVNHKLGIDGDWILDNDGIRKFMTKFVMMDGSILDIPPSGWYMIDGSYYFFDISGKPLTGLIISDGKYYFMQDDGKMKEGGEVIVDNIKYTFDKATGACRTFLAV